MKLNLETTTKKCEAKGCKNSVEVESPFALALCEDHKRAIQLKKK